MSTSNKVQLNKEFSKDLALRFTADILFDRIESLPARKIIIDFVNIESISRSFAQEYLSRKRQTTKCIEEINIPLNVEKMLDIVSIPKESIRFPSFQNMKIRYVETA